MKETFSHRKGFKKLPSVQKKEWDKVTTNKVLDLLDNLFYNIDQSRNSNYSVKFNLGFQSYVTFNRCKKIKHFLER